MKRFLIPFLFIVGNSYAAGIQKWVDEKGNIYYGDTLLIRRLTLENLYLACLTAIRIKKNQTMKHNKTPGKVRQTKKHRNYVKNIKPTTT